MIVLAPRLVAFATAASAILDGEVEVPHRNGRLGARHDPAVGPAVVGDRPVLTRGALDLGDLPTEEPA
jgi:hypothetical protein